MVLKLYGLGSSACTTRVATILHEKRVTFELVTVDALHGAQKEAEYLKKQPFGQIPYIVPLDDDGFILFESRAICRYIALKYSSQGTPLYPTDLKAIALVEQAASIEVEDFDKFAALAASEMVLKKKYFGLEGDKAIYEPLLVTLDAKLKVYNVILGKQNYLGGDEISLPDLFHLPIATLLEVGGTGLMTKYPNVNSWYKKLVERPSWQAVKDGVKSATF